MTKRTPVRSCISCRRKGEKGELVKLAMTPAGIVADYGEKLPGRGAYVCAEPSCIRKALDARVLSRAFRSSCEPPSCDEFVGALKQAMERRAASLLGMARKSGRAAWGFDACIEALSKEPGGLLVVAGDISENTLGKLAEQAPAAAGRAVRFLTREALGGIMSTAPVAVVCVKDRGIAAALESEIGRLKVINRGC